MANMILKNIDMIRIHEQPKCFRLRAAARLDHVSAFASDLQRAGCYGFRHASMTVYIQSKPNNKLAMT